MVAPGTTALVPGTPIASAFPLARYRFPDLQGAVRAYIRSATEPGDLVLAIGATSSRTIGEITAAQRRVVALGRNPIDLLRARLALTPVATPRFEAALTLLADQPKAGQPLILHIKDQYRSRCPRCRYPGTALWFAWDRDQQHPFAKRVACPQCDQDHEGPVDADDIARAGEVPVASGPAYHLALSRAVGSDHADSARIAQLVQRYTPRNLAVLMDLIQRLPRLHVDPDVRHVIDALLLEALDAGSVLVPYEAPTVRPRSLHTPQRFLERNVWMALEDAADAYRSRYAAPESPHQPARSSPGAGDLTDFLVHPERDYVLLNRSVQSLAGHDLEESFHGLIVHLTPPDATYWALAVLWSLWLWGDGVPDDLRGFLHRRRLDWDWYQRSLAAALGYARPYLAPRAPILLSTTASDLSAPRAIVHAARRGGLAIDRWLLCPPDGYRLLAHFDTAPRAAPAAGAESASRDRRVAAVEILRLRGEPTPHQDLTAAMIFATGHEDIEGPAPAVAGPVTDLDDIGLWLREPSETALPLADRVEALTFRLLTSVPVWESDDLHQEIYDVFHSELSPDPELVQAIIRAYTEIDGAGKLRLRPEDEPQRRRKEEQGLRKDLLALGERLGYSPVRRLNGDLVWREAGSHPYLFRMATSALLAQHLLKPPPRCDGRRCLVLPGGRAALTALKLRRDPRLAQLAAEHNWTFIKYRHLRRMVDEIAQRADIEVFLGLDPIVERQGAQIPLPLDMETRR